MHIYQTQSERCFQKSGASFFLIIILLLSFEVSWVVNFLPLLPQSFWLRVTSQQPSGNFLKITCISLLFGVWLLGMGIV